MKDHIFVHIPATAGIAIRAAIGSRRIVHDLARNHYQRPGVEWGPRFVYAFVRDPRDRLVSVCAKVFECYKHKGRKLEVEMFRTWVADGMPDTRVHAHAASPRMCTPQFEYLTDDNGDLLVDFIGRYETLDADVAEVCGHVGIPARAVPVLNTSNRLRDLSVYYDRPTNEAVAVRYANDFAAFGYDLTMKEVERC